MPWNTHASPATRRRSGLLRNTCFVCVQCILSSLPLVCIRMHRPIIMANGLSSLLWKHVAGTACFTALVVWLCQKHLQVNIACTPCCLASCRRKYAWGRSTSLVSLYTGGVFQVAWILIPEDPCPAIFKNRRKVVAEQIFPHKKSGETVNQVIPRPYPPPPLHGGGGHQLVPKIGNKGVRLSCE